MWKRCVVFGLMIATCAANALAGPDKTRLTVEDVSGDGVWVQPEVTRRAGRGRVAIKVWFDSQLLGRGDSYLARSKVFAEGGWKRSALRTAAVTTLKTLANDTWKRVQPSLLPLEKSGALANIERHWIVNGFSCTTDAAGLRALTKIKPVKKIFAGRRSRSARRPGEQQLLPEVELPPFEADRFKHPWYIRSLLADKTWKRFGVTGKGTLNIVHDGNFVFSKNLAANLYRNPREVANNGKDDDGNGLVDDVHGWNFVTGNQNLSPRAEGSLHGFLCAAIIAGRGVEGSAYEFGIAPEGKWAGVIGGAKIEAAVEWAIEQQADTYSMSFSMPNLGELRSHYRKLFEHGSLCGVFFVSGAGNFAKKAELPVQMRIPEDIPHVVFAAAGVQRDLSRTPFSSQGPVEWNTEHYKDGRVQKPAVCGFNAGLPRLNTDGSARRGGANGNSFAGPMFCGAIALLLSADPELMPWEVREIMTMTAMDVGPKGLDFQTGHGLINCYRAVKEALRRKALREGRDASRYTGREKGDTAISAGAIGRPVFK